MKYYRREFVFENPFAKVESFRVERTKVRVLTHDELRSLFRVCPPGSKYHALLMFYLITGARRDQAAKPHLRWDGVEFDEGFIYLTRQKQKDRAFPITPELRDILQHHKEHPIRKERNPQPDDHLYPFPFTGAHISRKIISPLLRQAGIKDATLHDLRRTCLTLLRNDLGYSTENLKDYVGHSSIRVTENHYLGRSVEHQSEMSSALASYLSDLADKSNDERTNVADPNESPDKNTDTKH